MIDLYKGEPLKFSHMPWLNDLVRHPITKKVIIMKSSAVGKPTFISELFKKRTEDIVVEKGLFGG